MDNIDVKKYFPFMGIGFIVYGILSFLFAHAGILDSLLSIATGVLLLIKMNQYAFIPFAAKTVIAILSVPVDFIKLFKYFSFGSFAHLLLSALFTILSLAATTLLFLVCTNAALEKYFEWAKKLFFLPAAITGLIFVFFHLKGYFAHFIYNIPAMFTWLFNIALLLVFGYSIVKMKENGDL